MCLKKTNLATCATCGVVQYCSSGHQSLDQQAHKNDCEAVREAQGLVDCKARDIQASGIPMPTAGYDEDCGGPWYSLMIAKLDFVIALSAINTRKAVNMALDNCLDLLRFGIDDSENVRCFVPALYLRLGRVQECYGWFHSTLLR